MLTAASHPTLRHMIADLLLTDADGDPVGVVEVRRRASGEGERQAVAAREAAGTPFAVLLTPEEIVVWDRSDGPPDRSPSGRLLAPLREAAGVACVDLPEIALQMLAEIYFEDLAAGRADGPTGSKAEALGVAVRGGRVTRSVRLRPPAGLAA